MLQIKISDAEIQRLNYERYYYPCPHVQKRIQAVYFKTIGMNNKMIGKLTGLHREIVGDWIRAYLKGGFEVLCQNNYGTNKSELEKHSEGILQSFTQRPPMTSCEAKARIEELTGISRSPSQVRSFMKRHGLRYLQTGHIPAKANTEVQQKWVKEKLDPAIEEAQNGKCHLLFMDASHFILQPFICALWCVARIFIKAASGRNRINVLGTNCKCYHKRSAYPKQYYLYYCGNHSCLYEATQRTLCGFTNKNRFGQCAVSIPIAIGINWWKQQQ